MMITLQSSLTDQQSEYQSLSDKLAQHDFSLGGNWDYDHGSFDCELDQNQRIWMRIPFQVLKGRLDGETGRSEAYIRLGQPYILRHLYEEGLDNEVGFRTYGGLFDQFQKPLDADAEIGQEWIDRGKQLLKKIEGNIS